MLFRAYTDQWSRLNFPLFKRATISTFRSHLVRLNAAFGEQSIEVPYPVAQEFFNSLVASLAPKTIRNIHTLFHMLLNAARREGLITKVPEIKLPKGSQSAHDWLTIDSLRSIIRDSNPTYRPLYATLAETGLRIGEALGLKGSDFNEEERTLTVSRSLYSGQEQTPKSAAAYRTIALSAYLVDILRPLALASQEGFLFRSSNGSPLWPEKILTKNFHPLLKDLKLKPMGFHSFRRGSATLMCSVLGVPEKVAAYRLGHRAPGLTLGLYAQNFTGIDKEWTPKIGEALFK